MGHLGTFGHVVRSGPDGDGIKGAHQLTCHVIHLCDELDLVAEEADAHGILCVRWEDVHRVSPHAEVPALQIVVVAVVLDVDEATDEVVALQRFVLAHSGGKPGVVLRTTDAIDATHRCHHDDVAPRKQARGCLMTQLLHLLVNGGVLLYISIGLRDVGLGLVVVVVADEVDHGVVGKELLHLGGNLRRQRLVGFHDERRALRSLDDLCHREGLSAARDAKQRLVAQALLDTTRKLGDGLGLVAGRLVGTHHLQPLVTVRAPKASELATKMLCLTGCRWHGPPSSVLEN